MDVFERFAAKRCQSTESRSGPQITMKPSTRPRRVQHKTTDTAEAPDSQKASDMQHKAPCEVLGKLINRGGY